jgi:hypothetical protein
MSRKPRKCRICKKRPVWTGGDVKNPGPVCKQCYHKAVNLIQLVDRSDFSNDYPSSRAEDLSLRLFCCRSSQVFLYPELHNFGDQRIRNRRIEWKPQIPLWS